MFIFFLLPGGGGTLGGPLAITPCSIWIAVISEVVTSASLHIWVIVCRHFGHFWPPTALFPMMNFAHPSQRAPWRHGMRMTSPGSSIQTLHVAMSGNELLPLRDCGLLASTDSKARKVNGISITSWSVTSIVDCSLSADALLLTAEQWGQIYAFRESKIEWASAHRAHRTTTYEHTIISISPSSPSRCSASTRWWYLPLFVPKRSQQSNITNKKLRNLYQYWVTEPLTWSVSVTRGDLSVIH
jgi:hypothetical protein